MYNSLLKYCTTCYVPGLSQTSVLQFCFEQLSFSSAVWHSFPQPVARRPSETQLYSELLQEREGEKEGEKEGEREGDGKGREIWRREGRDGKKQEDWKEMERKRW